MVEPHKIILHPYITEKTMRGIETQNKLVFMIAQDANRTSVKDAVEELYEVEVDKVNIMITSDGKKKAYVKLKPEYSAEELAARIGII